MSTILKTFDVSAQALSAQRAKMNAVAQNMANAETAETTEGGPYQRKQVNISESREKSSFTRELSRARGKLATTHSAHRSGRGLSQTEKHELSGVNYKELTDPESSFKLVHDPSHPLADEEGFVRMPDIDVITEMVDMMVASRAYEANTTVVSTAKKMALDALDI